MEENNKEKKERPNIISVIEEKDKTYYLCDDGFVYEADFDKKKLNKLDSKKEKEKILELMSRFHKPKYDVLENDKEREI